ncbi:xanthine dehydrogenase family protein molybdopterin-binding subunit [Caldimonas tepidiphila]|uniref:xanthine dehydrogenase family protein molybdopterin-binding subunit n=1 Tax=Caldimonas tepidiphila TaxID=2315841 RepID=UPI000E5BBCB1|nr:molybdopterin cofactor-binding domain-containing protein [Caldimonas tepidiphila]
MALEIENKSRRSFLLRAGGLAVGVAFGAPALGIAEQAMAQAAGAGGATLSPWVTIGTDGIVTIFSPAAEMGQGTSTAMPRLVAEDLDADWSKVVVKQAPHNAKAYGNKLFGGAQVTGASRTTRGYYEPLRIAGAQARQVLLLAAAGNWGVPAGELSTEPGVVVHKASGRRMGYGEVAAFARVPDGLPEITPAMLKPLSECRLIGKDAPRIDAKDKSTGRAVYGIDVRLPDMLHAAVLRPPVQRERPLSVDDSEAAKVKGFVRAVTLPYGVGVIATNTWSARKAREALKVTWSSEAPARDYTTDAVKKDFLAATQDLSKPAVVVEKHGDVPAAMAGAKTVLKADYVSGHLTHAALEPFTATARHAGGKLEVWTSTQAPTLNTLALAGALKMQPADITVHSMLLGGGFGRKIEPDAIIDAALLSKALDGRPVKVTWTREDEMRHGKPRPLAAQHVEVGLDDKGAIVALHHRLAGESIYARANPGAFQAAGGKDAPFHEGAEALYELPAHLIEYLRQQRGVDVAFWRGVGGGYTKFALESMIDEVAAARKLDPLQLRLQLLHKHPRAQAVLREAAAMAGWQRKRAAGRALGVAYSDIWSTHAALVAEVSVDRKSGAPKVHQMWCAVDCGVALLPDNVVRQVEGGLIWGLESTRAELLHKGGEVVQSNFHDYPVLRGSEVPRIDVRVLRSEAAPGGVGECGVPLVAPAVANAVARLTGKRLRTLPFATEGLKSA